MEPHYSIFLNLRRDFSDYYRGLRLDHENNKVGLNQKTPIFMYESKEMAEAERNFLVQFFPNCPININKEDLMPREVSCVSINEKGEQTIMPLIPKDE